MNYYKTEDSHIKDKADKLLYHVLWEPLGMPANTREIFKTDGAEHFFIANNEGIIAGAFVLVVHCDSTVELRHAAIDEAYQNKGIGTQLWAESFTFAKAIGASEVILYARNMTIGYWLKLGFKEDSGWFDHTAFKKYGIRFKKMVYSL